MIRLAEVSKSYDSGRSFAVRSLSLTVGDGELLVLLGESGCGKTTTLKMINRLIEPSSGSIVVGGEDTCATDPIQLRRRIGYAFQGIGLFPHMTVAENVGTVPHLLGWSRRDIEKRVHELLELTGLDAAEFADRYPRQLSGGQQQRVGVARALAARPKVLLLDEPFGALDPITRDELQTQFLDLHKTLGLSVVLVTHDMTEAILLANRIVVMRGGEIAGQGTPHQLLAGHEHEYVRSLMAMPKRQADQVEQIAAGTS